MKKITFLITLLLTIIVKAQPFSSVTFSAGDFQYTTLSPTTVAVSDYRGTGGVVVIPSSIVAFGDNYSVTGIGTRAFMSGQLTEVTIPNTIITIGFESFRDNSLSSLTIPSSVTSIAFGAFASNSLTDVIIPNSVFSIGKQAFWGNELTSVTLSNSITTIEEATFGNNKLTSIVIPNGVTDIFPSAFSGNLLTSVTLPNSLLSIGIAAFFQNQLTSVNIPNSVRTIGVDAFRQNNLTNITIPNSVTFIGQAAFADNSLTSVTIPNNVLVIEDFAFAGNSLISVTSLALDPVDIDGLSRLFDLRNTIDLIIPTGSSANYTTKNWTGFKSVTESSTLSTNTFSLTSANISSSLVQNKLTITVEQGLKKATIYSVSGKKVLESAFTTIDVSYLPQGIYILKVETTHGKTATKKIIKQ